MEDNIREYFAAIAPGKFRESQINTLIHLYDGDFENLMNELLNGNDFADILHLEREIKHNLSSSGRATFTHPPLEEFEDFEFRESNSTDPISTLRRRLSNDGYKGKDEEEEEEEEDYDSDDRERGSISRSQHQNLLTFSQEMGSIPAEVGSIVEFVSCYLSTCYEPNEKMDENETANLNRLLEFVEKVMIGVESADDFDALKQCAIQLNDAINGTYSSASPNSKKADALSSSSSSSLSIHEDALAQSPSSTSNAQSNKGVSTSPISVGQTLSELRAKYGKDRRLKKKTDQSKAKAPLSPSSSSRETADDNHQDGKPIGGRKKPNFKQFCSIEQIKMAREIQQRILNNHSLQLSVNDILCLIRLNPHADFSSVLSQINADIKRKDIWEKYFAAESQLLPPLDLQEEFECSICFCDYSIDRMFTLDCVEVHRFCLDCISHMIEISLNDGQPPYCPAGKICGYQLSEYEIRDVCNLKFEGDRRLLNRYRKIQLKIGLEKLKDVIACPVKGCNNFIHISENVNLIHPSSSSSPSSSASPWTDIRSSLANSGQIGYGSLMSGNSIGRKAVLCQECRFFFCSECKEAYHYGNIKCEEVKLLDLRWHTWKDEMRSQYHSKQLKKAIASRKVELMKRIEEFQQDEKWKQAHLRLCPQCNRPIEKTEGCDSMICGRNYHGGDVQDGCGASFSWVSALPYQAKLDLSAFRTVDVRKVDNADVNRSKESHHVKCSLCCNDICGYRFTCIHCERFSVCEACEGEVDSKHWKGHVFSIFKKEGGQILPFE